MTFAAILWLTMLSAHAEVHRFALLLGANRGVGEDGPLRYAESDAGRMAEVLQSHGGIAPGDVVVARGWPADRFDGLLDDLARRIEQRTAPGDKSIVVVYYSGHADATSIRAEGGQYPFSRLLERVEALPTDVKLLVVDACKAGSLTRRKGASPAEPFTIRPVQALESQGIAIMASSTAGEDAQESDRLRGGVFTHHLVGGLLGAADTSGDAAVSLGEAWRYAQAQTVRSTSDAPFVQHPSFSYALRGSQDVVLTQLSAETRGARLTLGSPGTWVLFRDDLDTVTEVEVRDQAMLALPTGTYTVRLRQPNGVRQRRLTLGDGEQTSVSAGMMAPVSQGRVVRKGLGERPVAWGFALGGGLIGSVTDGVGVGPYVQLGPQLELDALSLGVRMAYTYQGRETPLLLQSQHAIAATATVGRLAELGPFSVGAAVRLGATGVFQQFETPGVAPERQGLIGRVGTELDLELALPRRWTLRLAGAADLALIPVYDPVTEASRIQTRGIPTLVLEILTYGR